MDCDKSVAALIEFVFSVLDELGRRRRKKRELGFRFHVFFFRQSTPRCLLSVRARMNQRRLV